jgi:hypothetical protein
MTEVRYPEMRNNLRDVLNELSNSFMQWKIWIDGYNPNSMNEIQGFWVNACFIFDDSGLASDTIGCIGYYLKTAEEVTTIKKLVVALDSVINAVNKSDNDRDYITHPLWVDVLSSAREALDAFTRAEYGYPLKRD